MGNPILTILMASITETENFGKIQPQTKKPNNIVILIQNKPVALANGEKPETLSIQGPAQSVWIA